MGTREGPRGDQVRQLTGAPLTVGGTRIRGELIDRLRLHAEGNQRLVARSVLPPTVRPTVPVTAALNTVQCRTRKSNQRKVLKHTYLCVAPCCALQLYGAAEWRGIGATAAELFCMGRTHENGCQRHTLDACEAATTNTAILQHMHTHREQSTDE